MEGGVMRLAGLVVVGTLVVMDALSAQDRGAPEQSGLEFEVASIKRNTSDRPAAISGPPPGANTGQLTIGWIPARFLPTRAFPDLTTPLVVEGLPAWADSERWDVSVRFRPGATATEQAAMWKA